MPKKWTFVLPLVLMVFIADRNIVYQKLHGNIMSSICVDLFTCWQPSQWHKRRMPAFWDISFCLSFLPQPFRPFGSAFVLTSWPLFGRRFESVSVLVLIPPRVRRHSEAA